MSILGYTKAGADAAMTALITALKGAANGIASLDSGSKVPAGQLPDLSGTYALVAEPVGAAAQATANAAIGLAIVLGA